MKLKLDKLNINFIYCHGMSITQFIYFENIIDTSIEEINTKKY
jgi:glycyl-tRNA synthetase alpha subunit